MCVDRDQMIEVVFAGYASKVESLVGHISAAREPEPGAVEVQLCGGQQGARQARL